MTQMDPNKVETGSNSQGNSPSLATVLSLVNWGGVNSPSYPSYEGRCDATGTSEAPSSAAPDAGTGTPAAGAGSPPAGQNAGGSSAPTPQPGTVGTPSPNDDNLRVLRQNYETLKPWETVASRIKDPAHAVQAYDRQQKLFTGGLDLAKQLGYTEESFRAAFEDDPVDTIAHLRTEAAKANPQAAQNEQLRKFAEEAARTATKPVTEQINRQQTETAITRLDGEFERLVTDDKAGFGKDCPSEVREALYDLVNEMIPDNVLLEIKTSGKVSGVQAAFDQAKARVIKVINAYNAMEAKRAAAGGAGGTRAAYQPGVSTSTQPPNGAGKPLTLDDIINNPEGSLPGLKAGKY